MKKFFEEYGGVTLGICAVLVLIAMVTPVGAKVKDSLTNIVSGFSSGLVNGIKGAGLGNSKTSDETTGPVESGILSIDLIESELGDYTYQITSNGNTYLYIEYNEAKVMLENNDGSLYNNAQLEKAALNSGGTAYVRTIVSSGAGKASGDLRDVVKQDYLSGYCGAGNFMFDETDKNYIYTLDRYHKYFSYTKDSAGNLTNLTLYSVLKREKANYDELTADIYATINGNIEMNATTGINNTKGSYIEVDLHSYGITFNTDKVKVGQDVSSWFTAQNDENAEYYVNDVYEGNFNGNSFFKYCSFEVTKVEGNKVTILVGKGVPGMDPDPDPRHGEQTEGYIYALIPADCVYFGNRLYSEQLGLQEDEVDYVFTMPGGEEGGTTAYFKYS